MNKQAFDRAYTFGVQKALSDAGLVKQSGLKEKHFWE